jgi:putative DNA primase/helicase
MTLIESGGTPGASGHHADQSPVNAGRVSADEILAVYLEREHKGAGRNNIGFDLAVQLRDNCYSEDEATAIMFKYAAAVKTVNTKGRPEPYSEAEVRATLRSVYGRPARDPWAQQGHAGRVAGSKEGTADEEHGAAQVARAEDAWPQPEPLQNELPPVLPFSEELLPDSFRPLAADISERMQVPLDFPAAALVVCLAGVVNRRATIQPKAQDTGWIIVPNLWGGIIAPPGYLKSPTLRTISAPLYMIERVWREQYQTEVEEYEAEKEAGELRLAVWKEQSKAAFRKGIDSPLRPDISFREPTQKRLIIGDATFEKLHELMNENPAGLLVVRDELSGWLSQQDKPGREGERAFSLECWNGDSSHTIDRIGRGSIFVPACCLSMLGGITPGRLRSYLTDALEDRPGNDGLLQRFQLLVWPDCSPDWRYIERPLNVAFERKAAHIYQKLTELDPDYPTRLRFDREAQELFVEWLAELEAKIRGNELHPALVSHLSKYRRLMPALAGLFELADTVAGNDVGEMMSLKQAQRGAAWTEYLESHARRVYACIVTPQLRAARELADKIRQHKIGASGSFSCREVYWKGWRGLDSPDAVKQAAELLEDANWVRRLKTESRPIGGRPADRFAINPAVYK